MITRKNYEIYFIDYLEGNLSEKEITMVDIFLKENLDLKEEMEEFSSVSPLKPEDKKELDFSYLKKQSLIDEANEEDFFIGKIEGDLNEEQLKLLSSYLIENPEKKVLLASFEKTQLTPEVLMYPNKRSLKQTKQIGFYYYLTTGVAACIMLMLYLNVNLDGTKQTPLTAKNNEYEISLDKLETKEVEEQDTVEKEFEDIKLPKRKTAISLAQQSQQSNIPDPQQKEVPNTRKKNKQENLEPNKIKVKFQKEFKNELLALNPVSKEVILDPVIETTKTVKEFAKEKSISFIEERTTGKKDESQSLLAFAEKKAKEISLPDFIDYDNKKTEKQQVRTIRVGKLFSIKRKSRI